MAAIINNPTKEKEQQEEGVQKPSIQLSAGGGAAPGAPQATPATQGVQAKPASSGRFTNLQSYLGANTGAGQKIANVVGQGITKSLGQQKETEAKEAEQFRNAVQSAQGVNQQGQQALGQVSGADFDPSTIAGNEDALKSFTGLRTGTAQQAASESAQKEGSEAQNALAGLQQAYNKTSSQIQNPNDRFSLLQQYLASPKTQYGRGLSSLDNALLQQDPTKSLEGINKQITQEQKQIGKERSDAFQKQATQAQVAKEEGTKLAQDIQAKTTSNEQAMVKGLEDRITGANEARAAEQQWAKDQFTKLNKGEPVDQKFADMLGLQAGQRTYGVFQNMQDAGELLNMSPAQITSINQLASDADRARYGALAQLAGIDQSAYRVGNQVPIDPTVGLNPLFDFATRSKEAQQNIENAAKNLPRTSAIGGFFSDLVDTSKLASNLTAFTPEQYQNMVSNPTAKAASVPSNIKEEAARLKAAFPKSTFGYMDLSNLTNGDVMNILNATSSRGGKFIAKDPWESNVQQMYDYLKKQGYYSTI